MYPKYLAPPGVSIPTEYVQVFPEYQQMAATVNQYNRTIHRIAPDGNCLFRALAHQAFGDQIYHAQMRKALVTLISDNLERYKPCIWEEEIDLRSMLTGCLRTEYGVHNWKYKRRLIV